MTTAVKMYKIYPSFFSSKNQPKRAAEQIWLDTLNNSLTISRLANDVILAIAGKLPMKSFIMFKSTSHRIQRVLSMAPGRNELAALLAMEYMLRQKKKEERVQRAIDFRGGGGR
jgi:hypothetical protein